MAAVLSRASALAEPVAIKQRKVQAKSTIHEQSAGTDNSSDSDSDASIMDTFTPPSFTVKDLLGQSNLPFTTFLNDRDGSPHIGQNFPINGRARMSV